MGTESMFCKRIVTWLKGHLAEKKLPSPSFFVRGSVEPEGFCDSPILFTSLVPKVLLHRQKFYTLYFIEFQQSRSTPYRPLRVMDEHQVEISKG